MMNDVNTTDLPPYHDQRTQYGIDDTDPKAQAVLRRHLADLLVGKELAAKAYGDWSQFGDQ